MRFRPPLRVSVTRHGDKEQKLKEFVLQHISDARGAAGGDRPCQLQLIARSLESPVVKAIAGLAGEIASAGLAVRMILAHVDQDVLLDGWTHADHPVAFDHEIRWARRPRLIEAHEQLVLGPQTCWIGDSMRRDPAKCDAFESYVEGCGEAAGCALVSFERLWFASEALAIRPPHASDIAEAGAMPDAIAKPDAASEPTVATRH